MEIYNYAKNGEFLYSSTARPSPLDPHSFIIPANATTIAPPPAPLNKCAIFRVADNAWRMADDFRGFVLYKKEGGEKFTISEIGKNPGDYPDYISAPPPYTPDGKRPVWEIGAWTLQEPPPPAAVSMRQARLALLASGMLDAVETAIKGMAGDVGTAARIEWEYATEIRRDNPLLAAISDKLGISSQMDDLFVMAARL